MTIVELIEACGTGPYVGWIDIEDQGWRKHATHRNLQACIKLTNEAMMRSSIAIKAKVTNNRNQQVWARSHPEPGRWD